MDHIVISIHAPHPRGDLLPSAPCPAFHQFNPLPSHEGRPARRFLFLSWFKNFNPLPSHEGRLVRCTMILLSPGFQSTPLTRGETIPRVFVSCLGIFQSTPLMRGETQRIFVRKGSGVFQSTPLMRGETIAAHRVSRRHGISIHSPHARGDDSV